MYKININDLTTFSIQLFLIYIFMYQLFSFESIFLGNIQNAINLNPLAAIIREALYLIMELLLLSTFLYRLHQSTVNFMFFLRYLLWTILSIFIVILLFCSISIIMNETLVFLIPFVRLLQPLILFFTIGLFLSKDYYFFINVVVKLKKTVYLIIFIELLFTISEFLLLPPFYGQTFLGPRIIGTFLSPNTFGLSMLSFQLLIYTIDSTLKSNSKVVFLIFFMILAAGQRTSIAISFLMIVINVLFYLKKDKNSKIVTLLFTFIFMSILPILMMFLNSKFISGRNIDIRDEGRLSIYGDFISSLDIQKFLFGEGFGKTSNVLQSMGAEIDELYVADSMYISLLSNFGVIVSIFIVFSLVAFGYRKMNKKLFFMTLTLLLISSFTIVISDAIPFIYIVSISLVFSFLNHFFHKQRICH